MSDRPVPTGEPDQTPGWPPQQPPIGEVGAGPGVPPQPGPPGPPAGAFGAAPGMPQQQAPAGAFGAPQPYWQQAGFPAQTPTGPDWEALAASNEQQQRKRKRLRIIGAAVAVVVVLGAGGAAFLLTRHDSTGGGPVADGSKSPVAEGSKTPGKTASGSPRTIPGPTTVGSLPAAKGTTALGLGADAKTGSVAGFPGPVLKLPSGQNSFAQSAKAVVDTDKSFTVSARVFVDVPAGTRSAVSQGDGSYYSFALGRGSSDGRNLWYFKVQLPGGGSAVAYSKGDATVNQWALLTGVYDASAKQITLYVNGAAQASAPATGVQSSGADLLQVGRLSSNSQWSDPWHGAVADIQAWDQVLPEADIVKIVAGSSSPPAVPPTAAWLTG
ncbi:LamG domain-containing protein [Kitasatospora sp. NPDC057015]|uniref:LamG domain-containing protein n=1 Tax=Kitasatospora sp. NPDC057015 TaxID=3346001 RepID=UPI003627BD0F